MQTAAISTHSPPFAERRIGTRRRNHHEERSNEAMSAVVKATRDGKRLRIGKLASQKWPVLNLPANLNEKTETSEWYGPQ